MAIKEKKVYDLLHHDYYDSETQMWYLRAHHVLRWCNGVRLVVILWGPKLLYHSIFCSESIDDVVLLVAQSISSWFCSHVICMLCCRAELADKRDPNNIS